MAHTEAWPSPGEPDKTRPDLELIKGGKKSYDSSIFLNEADRNSALQELEKDKTQLGTDYERLRKSISERQTLEQLKKETSPGKVALTEKQFQDLSSKIKPEQLELEAYIDNTTQKIGEADILEVKDMPKPPPLPPDAIRKDFNNKLEKIYRQNIPSEEFASQFNALVAEKKLESARRSKWEAEKNNTKYTPLKISERKRQYLEDKALNETDNLGIATKKIEEIENLLDIEKPKETKEKPVLANLSEIEEVFSRNKGTEKVRISDKNYDALIQEISAKTKTPEEMIAETEKLDNMIEVIDPEKEEREEMEARRKNLAAQDAEDTLTVAKYFGQPRQITPYQYQALLEKWRTQYKDQEAFNKFLELQKYLRVEKIFPSPKKSTQEPERKEMGSKGRFESGKTTPRKSDYINLTEEYELTPEQARAAENIEDEIGKLKRAEISLVEADKILARYEQNKNAPEITMQEFRKTIGEQEQALRDEANSTMIELINKPENSEILGYDSAEFRKSEIIFYDKSREFKEKYGIFPEEVGSISKFRFRMGVLLGRKDKQMKKEFEAYQQAKKNYETKIQRLLEIVPDAIYNNQAYKKLAEAGRLI